MDMIDWSLTPIIAVCIVIYIMAWTNYIK